MPRPPSLGGVTSPFGMRYHPITGQYRMHNGEDTIGRGNYAPATGVVVYAAYDTTGMGFGNAVAIRLDADPNVIAWTCHHAAIAVNVGQHVTERVSYIGPIGRTGAATGIHAHQEFRRGGTTRPGTGVAINPRTFYQGGGEGGFTPAEGDEEMSKNVGFWYQRSLDGANVSVVCNPESGFYTEYLATGTYDNGVALVFGTGSYATLTEAHAVVIKKECARVLASKATPS